VNLFVRTSKNIINSNNNNNNYNSDNKVSYSLWLMYIYIYHVVEEVGENNWSFWSFDLNFNEATGFEHIHYRGSWPRVALQQDSAQERTGDGVVGGLRYLHATMETGWVICTIYFTLCTDAQFWCSVVTVGRRRHCCQIKNRTEKLNISTQHPTSELARTEAEFKWSQIIFPPSRCVREGEYYNNYM